jgi:Suppressor of fused protein (SUFU)
MESAAEPVHPIVAHMQTHVGKADRTVTVQPSLKIHIISPTDEDPVWTLFTTGMSDAPMTVPSNPDGTSPPKRMELILRVLQWDGEQMWPLRWLQTLAGLPSTHQTWLGASHTIPNGDASVAPLKAIAADTLLSCWLLLPPACLPDEADTVQTANGPVVLLSMVAIYQAEMEFQLANGADALLAKLNAAEIDDTILLDRKSAV